ncbi:hypothetical protein [Nocardiopsis lambiniae]|uniref:Uncharacterized protein n=1 Tax=Nocardiopsis lambiniae TaxID=3075539 RepID=A0ABU2M3G8_9ACTN|nr:hypothetical protein [Nocardiopsis sp. DSM 44743]MDT0327118.1 hypothetical protein [Nocardiopsis sp. DSM 44743]
MTPYPPAPSYGPPPMPTSLKAVRIILIIRAVLAVIVYGIAFLGIAAIGALGAGDPELQAQAQAEMGMGLGVIVAALILGLAITAFEIYVITQMGKGGTRAQTLLRIVAGIALVNGAIGYFTDSSNPFLGIVLVIIVIVFVEGVPAKEWFAQTNPGYVPPQPPYGGPQHPALGQIPGQYPPAPGQGPGYPPAPGQGPGYPTVPGQYPPAPGQGPGY